MCVFIFSATFAETFLMIRRNERAAIKMYFGFHVKYPLFSSDFNETWIFSTDFRKNSQIQNIMKIRTVGAELFHDDKRMERQTDMTKLFAILRTRLKALQFINIPKFPLRNVKQREYDDIN